MADNITVNPAGTTPVATDDIGGVHYQIGKVAWGPLDTANLVDTASGKPLPAQLRLSTGEALGVKEDAASADGDPGIPAMAVRQATPADSSGTDGDYEPLRVKDGLLWTRAMGIPFTVSTDVTRPADTTAYAVNDAGSDSTTAPTSGGFTLTSIARKSGGSVLITNAQLINSGDPGTPLQCEAYLFNQAVTNINDNAAFAISDAEAKTCVGILPFSLDDIGNNHFAQYKGPAFVATCSGSANLRFLYRIKNTYTPTSAETWTLVVSGFQID